MIRVIPFGSRTPSPGKNTEQNHDQRDHQKDMDYTAQRVAGYQAQQPENEEDYRDCI